LALGILNYLRLDKVGGCAVVGVGGIQIVTIEVFVRAGGGNGVFTTIVLPNEPSL